MSARHADGSVLGTSPRMTRAGETNASVAAGLAAAGPLRAALCAALALSTSACLVGPDYRQPSAILSPQFKEAQGWRPSRPADAIDKGAWWSVYDDPVLDGLERQVAVSNQNVAQFLATYRQARQITAEARATFFPTVSANGSVQDNHSGGGRSGGASSVGTTTTGTGGTVVATGGSSSGGSVTTYTGSLDASWTPDLWGRIRRTVESDRALAQASAADIVNAQLSAQGLLAMDYFALRANDVQQKLLRDTITEYQRYLQLTLNQYHAGTQSRAAVISAQTQLLGSQANLTDEGSSRAQLEHAIAVLTGQAPGGFAIKPTDALMTTVPVAPSSLPSTLLQRRPDIAAAERRVASANALIGVQEAAFYPDVSVTGSEGLAAASFGALFNASSNFWSVGGTIAEELIDFGARRAAVRAASAQRDNAIAAYRQTVLSALQGVEDELAILRVLQAEVVQRQQTEAAARQAYQLDFNEYKAGTVDFTTVLSAEATLYSAAEQVITIQQEQLQASALLIQDLGGGWETADLPKG